MMRINRSGVLTIAPAIFYPRCIEPTGSIELIETTLRMSVLGHSLPMHSAPASNNVRYAPDSDRSSHESELTRSAMCGRLRVGKSLLHVFSSLGRCSHVFGLLARHTRPLAIMPSADQVPVISTHSMMRWHKWVVLIAGSTGSSLRAVRPPNLHITPGVRRDLAYAASETGCLYRSPLA